jgi:hypothetical protein
VLAFFVMANFCKLLSDKGRVNWWTLCKKFGVEPVEKQEPAVYVEPHVEELEEIDRLMREPGRGAWHE